MSTFIHYLRVGNDTLHETHIPETIEKKILLKLHIPKLLNVSTEKNVMQK